MQIKLNNTPIKNFTDNGETAIFTPDDLVFATFKINNESFDVYIKEKDIERYKKVFKYGPNNKTV